MRSILALATVVTGLALFPAASPSLPRPLPPKDCDFLTVKGKRYNVKSDVRCRKARTVAKSLLTGGGSYGFKCRSNPTDQIRYYCTKGDALIYVIKR